MGLLTGIRCAIISLGLFSFVDAGLVVNEVKKKREELYRISAALTLSFHYRSNNSAFATLFRFELK